jgi:hypothetical protein
MSSTTQNIRPKTENTSLIDLPSFDEMMHLAETNPAQLEALRQQVCEQVIDSVNPRIKGRLQGLQFKINSELQLSKSPLAGCLKLSSMMNESLSELHDALTNPEEFVRKREQQKAAVIPLFK